MSATLRRDVPCVGVNALTPRDAHADEGRVSEGESAAFVGTHLLTEQVRECRMSVCVQGCVHIS